MVVFGNQQLGPASELWVSLEVARAMLRQTAEAGRPIAAARWERELVSWLDARGDDRSLELIDVADLAWTPEHFEDQQRFLIDSIERAAASSEHARALRLWQRMIVAHPRDFVLNGRRLPTHTNA